MNTIENLAPADAPAEWVTVTEARDEYGVNQVVILRAVVLGLVRARVRGDEIRYSRADLVKLAKIRTTKGKHLRAAAVHRDLAD